jgi:hypothetical protein
MEPPTQPQGANITPLFPQTTGSDQQNTPTVAGFDVNVVKGDPLQTGSEHYMVSITVGNTTLVAQPDGAQKLGVALIEASYVAREKAELNSNKD